MLNIYNDPCDLLFTKMKDFPEIPFNSVYSTESDDFQFDIINFPSNFEIPNDDSKKLKEILQKYMKIKK